MVYFLADEHERLVCGIFGLKNNAAAFFINAFESGFIVYKDGSNLSAFNIGLLSDVLMGR